MVLAALLSLLLSAETPRLPPGEFRHELERLEKETGCRFEGIFGAQPVDDARLAVYDCGETQIGVLFFKKKNEWKPVRVLVPMNPVKWDEI